MVLVHLGERARPIKFCGGLENLQAAIRNTFRDVLTENETAELLLQVCCRRRHLSSYSHASLSCALQVKDTAWDGAPYVDITADQEIEDRCQIRAVVIQKPPPPPSMSPPFAVHLQSPEVSLLAPAAVYIHILFPSYFKYYK